MTFTTADLDALKAALLTGAKSVQIGDRKIEYRDQSEIIKTIKMIETYLAGESTSADSPKVIQTTYRKGYSE